MKNNKTILLVLMGLLCGVINGVIGSGGGIIAVLLLTHVFNIENKKAHGTSISIILPLCIISSLVFIKNGIYDLPLIFKVSMGSIIGGIVGGKILSKISNSLIRRIFGLVMVISAIRMIF